MELVGVVLPDGDPDEVLDGFVQEYLLMGSSPAEIMFLFASPQYQAPNRIYRQKGHDYVQQRIRDLAAEWQEGWIGRS